jgi:hypothetical protein
VQEKACFEGIAAKKELLGKKKFCSLYNICIYVYMVDSKIVSVNLNVFYMIK